ncbi:peptide chain release factor 2 [Patescibacteria group bacterium]|nr:peptide chain release factor 2 [Patescibacteria group bacterium]MBU1256220.1 peptide chain release factor 2 [Patescibacteria group bacterium]MBU1457760.1 peptide chain release factor 2 [Patescibacteria group bacterium]
MDIPLKIQEIKQKLDIKGLEQKLARLQQESQDPKLWQDEEKAKKTLQELSHTQDTLDKINSLEKDSENLISLSELGKSQDDQSLTEEINILQEKLVKKIKDLELQTFLSGKHDLLGAIISIHSGQGGTEAMDWAAMLQRMYQRFFDLKGWKWQQVSESPGEEAGIKSAEILVNAPYAYGYLKGEAGTHRLVRLSPFNADSLRQTSFAGVEVTPIIEESVLADIKAEDLDIEFFRSGGPGGQNVNKLSTAVRLKHKPTGTVVECQTQRTQEQNRKIAMQVLASKLEKLEEEKREKELEKIKGEHKVPGWGQQIRSYVLHPYKQVKDHRTKVESKDPDAVLNGSLDIFIEAELSAKLK